MVVASLAETRRTKFITSRMQGRFGDDFALLRRGLLGDVLDGGDHAGELPGIVEHLVGAHHDQALHPVVGVQADGAVGRRQRLVQPHQHAAVGLAHAALEDLLAVFPSISSLDMPKSFSAARLTPVMQNSGSYRTSASESWSNTDSRTLVLCQPGVSLDMNLKLYSIIASTVREFAQRVYLGGMTPPQIRIFRLKHPNLAT